MSQALLFPEPEAPILDKREQVQQEALIVLRQYRYCGLAISMGVGKTYIGLRHIHYLVARVKPGARILVSATTTIINSWKVEALKHHLQHLLDHITFTTYTSLTKQDPKQFDLVILDECHMLTAAHADWMNQVSGQIVGMTGTPPDFGVKRKLVDRYCPIRYSYLVDQAVDDEILNDYRIILHSVSLAERKNYQIKLKDGRSWYSSESEQYNRIAGQITELEEEQNRNWDMYHASDPVLKDRLERMRITRLKLMQSFPSKVQYAQRLMTGIPDKCLVFANTKEQADQLCPHSVHSSNKNSRFNLDAFSLGTIKQLSCVNQLTAGVNIPGLRNTIILHAFANKQTAGQRIGRALRLNPWEQAVVHILVYKDTVDETKWVPQALENFNPEKIRYA